MYYESLTCPVCYTAYDKTVHLPKNLPSCGHTLCVHCLANILKQSDPKCPLDNRVFSQDQTSLNSFPTNSVVSHLIEEILGDEELCKIHKRTKKIVCLTDEVRICIDCVDSIKHKDHAFMTLKEARFEIIKLKQKLAAALESVNEHHQEIKNIIEDTQTMAKMTVKYTVEKIEQETHQQMMEMHKKKIELLSRIESFYKIQRQKVDDGYSKLKQELTRRIADCKDAFMKEDSFYLLSENYNLMMAELDSEVLQRGAEEFENDLNALPVAMVRDTCTYGFSLEILEDCTWGKFLILPELLEDYNILSSILPLKTDDSAASSREIFKKVLLKASEGAVVFPSQLSKDDSDTLTSKFIEIEPLLRNLIIRARSSDLTDGDLIRTLDTIPMRTRNLKKLYVYLDGCKNISDESMIYLAEEILPRMPNLKRLVLNLNRTGICDQIIAKFNQRIADFNRKVIYK